MLFAAITLSLDPLFIVYFSLLIALSTLRPSSAFNYRHQSLTYPYGFSLFAIFPLISCRFSYFLSSASKETFLSCSNSIIHLSFPLYFAALSTTHLTAPSALPSNLKFLKFFPCLIGCFSVENLIIFFLSFSS